MFRNYELSNCVLLSETLTSQVKWQKTSIVEKHFLEFLNQDNGFNQEFPEFHYENRLSCVFSCESVKKRKQMGSENDSNYTDFSCQINRQRIFKNHWNTINNQ